MISSTFIKNEALKHLKGFWAQAAIITIVFYVISFAVSGTSSLSAAPAFVIGSSLLSLLILPLSWGFIVLFLDKLRGGAVDAGNLFDGYKDFWRVFGTLLLRGVYTFLWTLLLIVPGIVKSLSYAMTPFILKDNPKASYDTAIIYSMRLMQGHKMDLFVLYLSFIGWFILSCLTLGIGFVFLVPYCQMSLARFYEEVKADFESDDSLLDTDEEDE